MDKKQSDSESLLSHTVDATPHRQNMAEWKAYALICWDLGGGALQCLLSPEHTANLCHL